MTSELVKPHHLQRRAVIYVRQSTPHQVLTNQESLRLQYALHGRAQALGWHEADIEVIDSDLGTSGAASEHRRGFKDLVARVTLGEVGLILSIDVTRLARNCSDWYSLLDVCGHRECLIADRDGVYDPGTPNGRLLLGLKGTIAELALHTIRSLPDGGPAGQGRTRRAGLAIAGRAGARCLRCRHQDPGPGGAGPDRSGVRHLSPAPYRRSGRSHAPRARACAAAARPRWPDMLAASHHPGGHDDAQEPRLCRRLCLWPHANGSEAARGRRTKHKCRSLEEWKIVVKDRYPAFIEWKTFERIQTMLRDNRAEYLVNKTRGIPRDGAALLHGITWCGECGHKMTVRYKGGSQYVCNHLRQQHGIPVCQCLRSAAIDASVAAAFLAAVAPAEIDAWARARKAQRHADETLQRAEMQQIERLRYEARLAERQFNRVDPDNRLVAAELERRWETALCALRRAEEALARPHASQIETQSDRLDPRLRAKVVSLGQRLPELWADPSVSREHRKALLRCLIDKVVLRRAGRDSAEVRIVWRGGETTELKVLLPVNAVAALPRYGEMEQQVLTLARAGFDDVE